MDEDNFLLFAQYYLIFKKNLENKLNNQLSNKIESGECYIIYDEWINEILSNYNKYNENKKYKNKKNVNYFPKNNPTFINTINDINDNIQNIAIINPELLGKMEYYQLNNLKIFKYYIGYQKLIIEDQNNNNFLIKISYPLDKSQINGILLETDKKEKKDKIAANLNTLFDYNINATNIKK